MLCCTWRYPPIALRHSPGKNLEFSVFAPDFTRLLIIWGAVVHAMGRMPWAGVCWLPRSISRPHEFHDWYDLEHIPERRGVPGFGACERWISDEQPTLSVATYDLDSVDVLRSKAYASVAYGNLSVWSKRVTAMCKRLLRFEGTQITPGDAVAPEGAQALLLNAMNIAPEAEDDFNAWYDQEHLDALAGGSGHLGCATLSFDRG